LSQLLEDKPEVLMIYFGLSRSVYWLEDVNVSEKLAVSIVRGW
jgi:hypothetical protein